MYRFIVNPNAGSGRGFRIWRRLERKLRKDGREYWVYYTANQGEAASIARDVTTGSDDEEIIVVVGGEGTYNEVLNGISFKGVQTIGYIPAGFRNALYEGFKSGHKINRQIKSVLHPTEYRLLDYAVITSGDKEIFNRRFAGRCGIGLDAAIYQIVSTGKMSHRVSRLRMNSISRFFTGLRLILLSKPVKGSIVFDGDKKSEFNNIYYILFKVHSAQEKKKPGRRKLTETDEDNDGKMTVYVASIPGKLRMIPILMDLVRGNVSQRHGVHRYECAEASVRLERQAAVHTDGESCGLQQNMEVRCIPKRVRLIETKTERRFHADRTGL